MNPHFNFDLEKSIFRDGVPKITASGSIIVVWEQEGVQILKLRAIMGEQECSRIHV